MLSVKTTTKEVATMATLNISMSDEMRVFIEARVSDLIRHDHKETERLLIEGAESGIARPLDMADLKKRAQTLFNHGKRSK
jgi:hypothetical protein